MEVLAVHTFSGFLGLELTSGANGRVMGRLLPAAQHLDGSGGLHEAIVVAMADAVVAHAAELQVPDGSKSAPVHSETNFIRRPRQGELSAEAVPLHLGPSTMKWETTVRDRDGQPLAVLVQTRLIHKGGHADQPQTKAGVAGHASGTVLARTVEAQTTTDGVAATAASDDRPTPSTPDLRRAQILKAAFKVISKKGFSSASTREIAREAGMSVPAMYQYVRSKDELLEEIFSAYLNKVEASVQVSTSDAASATDKLRAAVSANMAQFDRFQAEIRVMNRETQALRPEVRQRVKQHMLDYIELFRSILEQGVASGEFRKVDAGLYANLVPLMCDVWPLRNWAVGGRDVTAVRDAIIDLLLHALTPAPTRKRAT